MPSVIKVTSLVAAESPASSVLIEVDEFLILIDCGWTELFIFGEIAEIVSVVERVDCILISMPDIYHLGALPYLYGRGLINCPIYATDGVHKMGQMFLYDIFQSRQSVQDFATFSIDDVDAVFAALKTVKYNQTIRFPGDKGEGLKATAVNAGHLIGGSLWRIQKEDEEDIVFMNEFNLRREVHLNPAAIDSFDRPHLLILDGYGLTAPLVKRKERDVEFFNLISTSLAQEKNVLIVTDTAGRILEVSLMLEQLLLAQKSELGRFPIVVLSHVSSHVFTFARSLVESMSDKISKSFQATQANPYNFSKIQFIQSLAEVDALPNPKVVLSSQHDLESGFALDLFMRWAPLLSATVIFSRRAATGSLTQRLMADLSQPNISVKRKRRVPLEGAELEAYNESRRVQQEALALKMQEVKEEEELIQEAVFEDRESFLNDAGDSTADQSKRFRLASGTAPTGAKVSNYLEEAQELRVRPLGWIEYTLLRPGFKPNPIYPFIPPEDNRAPDDFGMLFDIEDLKKRLAQFGRETRLLDAGEGGDVSVQSNDAATGGEDAAGAAPEPAAVPTKCIEENVVLDIKATLSFIDWEGRSDSASLIKDQTCLLKRVIPRKLLVYNTPPDAVAARRAVEQFAAASEEFRQRGTKVCYVDRIGQPVDCSSEANIYQAKLHPSLLRELQWHPLGRSIDIAPVLARISYAHSGAIVPPTPTVLQDEPANANGGGRAANGKQQLAELPYLYPAVRFNPYKTVNGQPASHCFHDPSLRNLRKVLIQNGVLAEFLRGALVCNDKVVMMKTAQGKLHIQGPFSTDYLRIRQIVYDHTGVF